MFAFTRHVLKRKSTSLITIFIYERLLITEYHKKKAFLIFQILDTCLKKKYLKIIDFHAGCKEIKF